MPVLDWFGAVFVLWYTSKGHCDVYSTTSGTTAAPCPHQRRRLYECLSELRDEMQLISVNITLKILTDMIVDPFMAQEGLLDKYEGMFTAWGKCRKLDKMFDTCAPIVPTPLTHRTNESLYIMDKLECTGLAHQHPNVIQASKLVAKNIQTQCFQRDTPVLNPCVPTGAFQKCMHQEMLKTKLVWLENRHVGSQYFSKAINEAQKDKLSRWRCFECIYLTEERCRPSVLQHDCAIAQTAPRVQSFGIIYRNCMIAKGYNDLPTNVPDVKMYLRDGNTNNADFCGWIVEDMWM